MIIVIPKIEIRNATAMASWGVVGFPSMTGWLGAMHKLQRNLNSKGYPSFRVDATGVVVNKFNLRAYRGRGEPYWAIIGRREPLDHRGKIPGFKQDPTCDITASIIIDVSGWEEHEIDDLLFDMETELMKIRVASGDTMVTRSPIAFNDHGELEIRDSVRSLVMPGYAIIERRDLVQKAMVDGQDPLDAVIDYLKIYHLYDPDGWYSHRKDVGWIVPISTGYHAISDYDVLPSQRDPDVLHRFAEGVTTLGQFVMPWRLAKTEDMLWHYAVENNLYICKNSRRDN